MKKFEVVGVDITITKNIPVGGGLGGSSADIVGVLKGLKALFEIKDDITPLANAMGSDCAYMLEGGFAKMEGRGEIVTKIPTDRKLYFIIISEDRGISAKECYAEFDKINRPSLPCTDRAIDLFLKGDDQFYSCIKNDLFESSLSLLPVLQDNIDALKNAGAQASLMTGSGSSVYGVFSDKRLRDNAYKKLKKAYGDRLIRTETV